MRAQLLPHVHAVVVEDDLVVLDAQADAYLCLPGAAGSFCFLAGADADTDGLAEALVEQGLAQWCGAPVSRARPPSLPDQDVLVDPPARATSRDVLRLLAAYADFQLHYRGRSFDYLLKFVRRRGRNVEHAAGDKDELRRLCAVFSRLVVWAPISGKCLERSFLLLRFLQRSRCDANWVFGVTTWPFSAHCWLQVDQLALDDAAERLTRYAPILVA